MPTCGHVLWSSAIATRRLALWRLAQVDAGRTRESIAADHIDRRMVVLDRAPLFGLGVMFAPMSRVGAIDGCLGSPNDGTVERGGAWLRTGHDAPWLDIGFGGLFNPNRIGTF
jgi:hypothetical protein